MTPTGTTREELLAYFDSLVLITRKSGHEAAAQELGKLDTATRCFLAIELGVPRGSKAAVTRGILGRVCESILLSKNWNVTKPVSDR